MKIGIFNSAWGNMGNAFFALGLISFLRKNFPQNEVFELEDPQGWTFPNSPRLRKNGLITSLDNDIDVYVFTGPILKQIILPKYDLASVIKKIKHTGKEYMILSSSASEMSYTDIVSASETINSYPPLAFATRDEETYIKFKQHVSFCHNGICCAFLIPYIDGVIATKRERPYFISSFYRSPEPYFSIENMTNVSVSSLQIRKRKPFIGLRWGYARHFEWIRKDYPIKLDDLEIVRVHQGFNPAMKWFNYSQPNSFVSYNPRCYLSLYKGCEFVVTDRVHACVAALSYGHPARLLYKNDRQGIFTRMGYNISSEGIILPIGEEQYKKEIESFKNYLVSIFSKNQLNTK